MGVEIEKKYRLTAEQESEVLLALQEECAEYVGEEMEENIIYGGGVLDEQKSIIRVRRTANRTILTYKRRIFNELAIKQQTEHESEVADAAEVEAILESLGFVPVIVYEKRRRTWRFRSVEIVVDELPFGLYMEIEGPVMSIAEAEMYLGFEELEPEHETYPQLTMHLGTRNGSTIEARFDDKSYE